MEVWILDRDFKNIAFVDTFESLIWTERYVGYGNFELYTATDLSLIQNAQQDYYVWLQDSDQVMIIEDVQISTEVETGGHLTISGRSLESLLDRRIVWTQTILSGNLQNAVRRLLNENVISPSDSSRRISNFIFEASTDPAVTGLTIQAQYTGDNLYTVIEAICVSNDLGFHVTLNDNNQFVFKLYAGTDRSYAQITNPYVIFSPQYENVVNSNYLESKKTLKNITLVAGEDKGTTRQTTTVGSGSGIDRRELYTDARDIQSERSDSTNLITSFSVATTTRNGVTVAYDGDGKIKVSGTPTTTNFNISLQVSTVASIPRGKYTISGGVSGGDGSPNYTLAVSGVGSVYNDNSNDTYFVVNSTLTNRAVTIMVNIPAGMDLSSINATFRPSLVMSALHDTDYFAQLTQRGKEKLAENITTKNFEGQIEAMQSFVYGKDFVLGDIVQIVNEFGIEAAVRIMEIVRCHDTSGYEMYPTFSVIDE